VDWPVILETDAPTPAVVQSSVHDELAEILAAFDELLALEDSDAILKRAVELARDRIGLKRVGLFLLDEKRQVMLGAWGTDLEGHTVDEHRVMYDIGGNDRDAFQRARAGVHFTVIENCPIVVQLETETRVVGRGWVVCTPIRSARADIGMMFNDCGLSGEPVDVAKQTRAAILCSLLGTILDLTHSQPERRSVGPLASSSHPMIVHALRLLAKDPSLTGKHLALKLGISLSRLARVFKADTGLSLVEYRNRLRLERFQVLVDAGGENLLEAALAAGFGSYAQFHRVFRALRGATPREYLRRRGQVARQPPTAR
jgi:AraC-like DNA-binding protein